MKTTVKLTKFEFESAQKLQAEKQPILAKENLLFEVILGNAGITMPVVGIEIQDDQTIIVTENDPVEAKPEKKVRKLKTE